MEEDNAVDDFMREFADFEREIAEPQDPVPTAPAGQTLYGYESSYLRNDKNLQAFLDKLKKGEAVGHGDATATIAYALKASEKLQRSMNNLAQRVREIYHSVFPEVLELTQEPVKLGHIVLRLNDFADLDSIDFSDILDKKRAFALIMALQGKSLASLTPETRDELLNSCRLIVELDGALQLILAFLQSRLAGILPNVVAIVGDKIAARLLVRAGSLQALAVMPACNIQVMGSSKESLVGESKTNKNLHLGMFRDMELVRNTETKHQTKLVKLLASGVSKAAKVDLSGFKRGASVGGKIYKDILAKFEKHVNPKTGEYKKPLPAPDSKPKKRRGGKKYRRMKERLGLTDVREMKNRLAFGTDVAEDNGTGEKEMGMLAQQASGRLRVNIKKQKTGLTQNQKKRLNLNVNKGTLDGLKSTLAFSHNQAIELVNPQSKKEKTGSESVFGDVGFKSVIEQRNKQR